MPPEHEDLNRQLEALQRYVADLNEQRKRAKAEAAQPAPAPQSQRPSKRWVLLTVLLVIVALTGGLFVGAVAWSDDRPAAANASAAGAPSATRSPNTTNAVPVASPACKTAVDRANTMLAIAVALQRTVAEYDKILIDASNGGLSSREVRERSASVLKAGTSESARFNQALADYRRVVDQCKLQVP
jgi:flagellar basal body-associated protein FliL